MKRAKLSRVVFTLLILSLLVFGSLGVNAQTRWTMVTTWPETLSLHIQAEMFVERVNRMGGGDFIIDIYPSGAIVDAFEVLDAVNDGIVEIGHGFSGYWMGMVEAAPFFSSIPMHFEPFMHYLWAYEGGGLEFWERAYQVEAGRSNVIPLPCGNVHGENLAWSNRPLTQMEDWVGLKFRTVGWWGEMLRDIGASITTLPASELYPAMERGVLDALEFSSPVSDYTLSFHEVAEYVAGPAMHQPSVMLELYINKDAWNALPEHYQAIVEVAAEAASFRGWLWDTHASMYYLQEYFPEQGVKPVYFDVDSQRDIREKAWSYIDELAENDPFLAEVWESAQDLYFRFKWFDQQMMPIRASDELAPAGLKDKYGLELEYGSYEPLEEFLRGD